MDPNNIYANYATALHGDPSDPNQFAGNVAQAKGKIDDIVQSNAATADDPSKAKQVLLPNNQGYAFYDGAGKQISINDYSLLTGKRPDELLADSASPKDQKFVQDYKTLMEFTSAWVNGDKDTLTKLKASDPDQFNNLVKNYKSPSDVINAFTQHWSDYYNPAPNANSQSTSSSNFAPSANLNIPGSKNLGVLDQTPLSSVLSGNSPAPVAEPTVKAHIWDKLLNPGRYHQAQQQTQQFQKYQTALSSNPWAAYQGTLAGNPTASNAWDAILNPPKK